MSERRFAFASVSVAIVLGVFFYPPPARHAATAARVSQGADVARLQQVRSAAPQTGGARGQNGVD